MSPDAVPARRSARNRKRTVSGTIFVQALAPEVGERQAGRLLRHAMHRTFVDESVESMRQRAEIQAGPCNRLQILERHAGCAVQCGQAFQSF